MAPPLQLVQQWLEKADIDLKMAAIAIDAETPLPAPACFHCQQAAEKSFKAYLIWSDVEFPWTHDIDHVLRLCIQRDPTFATFRNRVEHLTDYASNFRYPRSDPDPTTEDARQALAAAREVFQFVLDHLPAQTHPQA